MKYSMLLAPVALLAGPVAAQTAAKPTPVVPAKPAAAPRSAQSIECSKEADAKGLHGKARKAFRGQCKSEAAKK